jgi:hypothetical protein
LSFRSSTAGAFTTSGLLSAMALPPAPPVTWKVPPLRVTVPVPAFRAPAAARG